MAFYPALVDIKWHYIPTFFREICMIIYNAIYIKFVVFFNVILSTSSNPANLTYVSPTYLCDILNYTPKQKALIINSFLMFIIPSPHIKSSFHSTKEIHLKALFEIIHFWVAYKGFRSEYAFNIPHGKFESYLIVFIESILAPWTYTKQTVTVDKGNTINRNNVFEWTSRDCFYVCLKC